MNRSTARGARALLVMWGSVALGVVLAVTGRPVPPGPATPLPACAAEDGGPYPCVWDGPNRGNRQGAVVIIRGDD